MSEEISVHKHHHSHSGESKSEKSRKSHRSSSHKSSSGRSSKSRRNVVISIMLNVLLIIAGIALGIMSGGNALYGVALFALFNVPLLLQAYFSLKLRKIPSYEYKADVYKHYSAAMLTVSLPIALLLTGVLFVLGFNRVDNDQLLVNDMPLIIGGLAGVIVNGLSVMLLKRAESKTVACKTVYDNSVVGTLISAAALVAGIMLLMNEELINSDPYVTMLIAIVTAVVAVKVLYVFIKRGFHMLPDGLEIEQIISTIKLNESVKNYRHLNIWTNNAEEVELSAHLSLDDMEKVDVVKAEIKEGLRKMGVDVVTLAFKRHREDS